LSRIRTRIATFALILVLPVTLAACGGGGGGGGTEDPQQVLDQTFSNSTRVTSAHINISLNGSVEGSQSGSFDASIDGAFQGDPNDESAFPEFDLAAKLSGSASGQSLSFDGSLVATKDNAYVVYQDQAYEVGTATFQQFAQAYAAQAKQAQGTNGPSAGSILSQFGVDPKSWLTNLSNEGDADVEGTNTVHIHGDADVGKLVADLGKIAQQAPGSTAQNLTPAQLDQLKSAVKSASIDIYSGKDDHLLRKLSVSLDIAPPSGSVSGVKVEFSITLSDVNQPQTVTAPTGAKPIADLLSQLGIPLSGLGGSIPGLPGSTGGSGGAGRTGGGGPSAAYLNCIQSAQSAADVNKCAQQLQ
jgi:hypothetical protein